jgi:hypothetical protein
MKVFTIDLDKEPENRWEEVIWYYKDEILKILKQSEIILCNGNDSLYWGASKFLSLLANIGFVYYYEELKGIAKILNVTIGEVIMLQLAYEFNICCTSILKKKDDGVYHFRTMEWNISESKPVTINVNFVRNGKIVFGATTWAGYIGILTGMKPNQFGISVNYRNSNESYLNNVYHALKSAWPVSFLVRHVLTNCDDYEEAKFVLEEAEIISPTYFILSGKNDGCLITRNRINRMKPLNLVNHNEIVQTNIDHWSNDPRENIENSIERREYAYEWINDLDIDMDDLWDLMNQEPILVKNTIYATGMCVAYNYYESKLY